MVIQKGFLCEILCILTTSHSVTLTLILTTNRVASMDPLPCFIMVYSFETPACRVEIIQVHVNSSVKYLAALRVKLLILKGM